MQRWEHCVLGGTYDDAYLRFFTLDGLSLLNLEKLIRTGRLEVPGLFDLAVDPKSEKWRVINQIIAKLGDGGWEMLSASDQGFSCYFKRPKAD